jgi:hypothetical protein
VPGTYHRGTRNNECLPYNVTVKEAKMRSEPHAKGSNDVCQSNTETGATLKDE